jgi:hypothetical protein
MATKAELEAAYERCEQIRRGVAAELHKLDFPAAVKLAETALAHQHAAVTFQRRFQNTIAPTTLIIDLILRYAPPCFLSQSLDTLEAWYLGGTKTERSALPDIPEQIAVARTVLARAVELWEVLAESPTAVLRPAPDSRNKALLSVWLSGAVVAVHPHDATAYFRVTDSRRDAVAKCSACGRERRAPMADFHEPSRCPSCGRRSDCVLIRRGL